MLVDTEQRSEPKKNGLAVTTHLHKQMQLVHLQTPINLHSSLGSLV